MTKYPLFHVGVALFTATAATSAAHAEGNVTHQHAGSATSAYLSGSGFSSQRDSYAAQTNDSSAKNTVMTPNSEAIKKGHSYSLQEEQYFSGRGFDSGTK